MDDEIKQRLDYLGMKHLVETWEETLKAASRKKPSYHRFLSAVIDNEYLNRKESRRLARLNAARIPETLVMETYPFNKQPKLKKKMVMEIYDSLNYIHQFQVMCLIGPTGCGKTGLGTAYLINAINQGYRGRYIDFKELVDELYKSVADYSEKKVLRRYESYDCLLIDELGYRTVNKDEAGLFFELMKRRHRKKCTIITTQLGFDEWNSFLKSRHLTMALVDRLTENCTVFNMKECDTIRPKKMRFVTE